MIRKLIRKFLKDVRGNYAMMTAIAIVPIMGGLALAIDYGQMTRQRQDTLNALDAAGIATAYIILGGATDEQAKAYARDFFDANLGSVDPADATLTVVLPANNTSGGGTLKLTAEMKYRPYFLPTFATLIGKANADGTTTLDFNATSEIRLKNTMEVALVLDNSGSMKELGHGSSEVRFDLLKTAATELVETIAKQAAQMKQVSKPVQFSVVPFAASVNVGPENAGADWMDSNGLSPVHHENFEWTTLTDPNMRAEKVAGIWYKRGDGWGDTEDQILSRFSLYQDMTMVSAREWVSTGQEYVCDQTRSNGTCKYGHWEETGGYVPTAYTSYASWQGCVEVRPSPYNVSDAPVTATDNASLFVPMFGPDEAGDRWGENKDNYYAPNNWWNDGIENATASTRQRNMAKYFVIKPYGATTGQGTGPNYSCTTTPITPLTDISTADGKTVVKNAINAMAANGATNVPEGMAWGWRALSHSAPFTEGRSETEKGNDKVVIVLTDGANTYYTPGSLGYSDSAGNKSIYSNYGYLYPGYDSTSTARLFTGTSSAVSKTDYSNANYTKALNEHFTTLCANAKAAGVIVMTIALDLDSTNTTEKAQIDALKACSSESKFRKDETDPSKAAKLFWNATGSSLSDDFKEIANELSNLRIVG